MQYTKTPIRKGRYSQSNVTADRLLTNVSVGYFQSNMDTFLHQIFPVVPVQEETGRYYEFSRDDLLRADSRARRPGADFARKTFGIDQPRYACDQYSLEIQLPDEARDTVDSPLENAAMARILSQDLLIRTEIEFMSAFLTPTSGVWDYYRDGSGADFVQWNEVTGVDIIGNIRAWSSVVKRNCAMRPNTVALTSDVWDVVQDDPDVLDRIKGMGSNNDPAITMMDNFAAICGLERCVVGDAIQNVAGEGVTYDGQFIQTNRCWVGYVAPSPSKYEPSAGYRFSWTPFDQVRAEAGLGANIGSYRHEPTMSDVFRGMTFFDFKAVASGAGMLAHNVLAPA